MTLFPMIHIFRVQIRISSFTQGDFSHTGAGNWYTVELFCRIGTDPFAAHMQYAANFTL